MAYSQNGNHHPQYPSSQPPLPPLPPHATTRSDDPYAQFMPDASSYPNGMSYSDVPYGSVPGRHNSVAARQNEELFMGSAPPPPPRSGMSAQSYGPPPSTYNPSDYAYTNSPTTPLTANSPMIGRRPSAPSSAPLPYNPADYVDPRQSPASPYGSNPYPAGAQPLHMPSPPIHQSPVTNRQNSMYSARPSIHTGYSSQYHGAGPPPLPVIPSAGDSPSEDWGRLPGINRYATRRYNNNPTLQPNPSIPSPPVPSPPAHQHSRDSSSGAPQYGFSPPSQLSSPGIAPPPPPHASASLNRSNSRPLPRLPSNDSQDEYFSSTAGHRYDQSVQADLENDILGAIGATPSPRATTNGASPYSASEGDDEDLEALAGLQAMREAEKQEADDAARRASGQSTLFSGFDRNASVRSQRNRYVDSDSDVPPVDLSAMGGGYDVGMGMMSYGGDPSQLTVDRHESLHGRQGSQTVSSSGSISRSRSGNASDADNYYSYARVDGFGTGGLADPNERRLSFDEGDEEQLIGEPPEMFYHPGITNRPLPPPPPEAGMRHTHSTSSIPYPSGPDHIPFPRAPSYPSATTSHHHLSPGPGRHTSLLAHSSTPPALTPIRAKTDAEERRKQQRHSFLEGSGENTAAAGSVALDLPSLTKKYNPTKLTHRDFDLCREPWALSALAQWLRRQVEEEQYLKKQPLVDGLVALFTHKVPTMNTADAETLSASIIDEMHSNGTLVDEEEWVMFSDQPITGVIFQLTGQGCYSSMLHNHKSSARCYSYHCQRTEKKIDLSSQADLVIKQDWAEYYHLTKDDISSSSNKEVARQNILHEIVQKEENYLRDLNVLLTLYRDTLKAQNPPVIPPKKLNSFMRDVFGKAEAVKKSNEDHLLPQMKYRQQEQGPWVVGFSDIFREWVRKAKTAYIEYAAAYPQAIFKVKQEMSRNVLFSKFLAECQQNPRSNRLGYDHFLKQPITRLQQVILLLNTAYGKSVQDNEEKRNLALAIEELRAVALECDAKVGEGQRKVDLAALNTRLKLRPEMREVNLHLDHLGRELIFQGELLRGGQTKFNWLETHAILFDHYMVLAKPMSVKTPDGQSKFEYYDVSRYPIPMDLLVLESDNDDPVQRSTLTGVTKVVAAPVDRLTKVTTRDSAPNILTHSQTSTSLNTMGSAKSAPPIVTNIEGSKDEKIMFPFKVKHLGKETYTLYAPSSQNREDWCNKIIEAKTRHANALFAQNAEPFKMTVIADTAFAYDGVPSGQGSIIIKGTPLDRAIREVEAKYVSYGRPGPVCRARVNCATSFRNPNGKAMVAVGTDYGVYISEENNPRGWQKVISNTKVTQVAVLEDFSIFLVISEKSLVCYHLDIICPPNGIGSSNDTTRRPPQKLSGNRDVGFFATGRMKDRTLVFYKKRDVSSSTFKVITVLEPVLQKSTEKKSRFPPLRSGKTEFFRDYDEFYIPVECTGMNVFHSSIAICSQKGFEILNLDRKQPMSIPTDIDAPHVVGIAQKLSGQRPLGMFRLSDQEFLLCFEMYAVYINKHGDISRSAILEFVGKARTAALFGPYIILFDSDFVEIRNANNGRLRQVISGRDVKCLDDGENGGSGGKRAVKISMQHPEIEKNQIVVELVLNEGLRE